MQLGHPIPILFTIPNFITAGSGRVMANILERLDHDRFLPSVCVLKKGGRIDQELEELGIPLLELPFTVPVQPYHSFAHRVWRTAQPFRKFGFQIWHSFHYADDYSEPVIARLSGARHWVYTKKSMSWGSRAWLLRSYLASKIVADNTEMLPRFFNRAGLRNKVMLVPHGLSLEQFNPSTAPTLDLRQKYGIGKTEVVVGCVAQLVPVKDHPTLIYAAAKLPGIHFLLAGSTVDQEYWDSLVGLVNQLGLGDRVHFCGNVNNIPAFLSEVDIFVLPTQGVGRMEGCPVALLEAMACGKPCIATDISGSRDLIIHNQTGLLVPPGDPEALAEAARTLINKPDLRNLYGQAARRRVEEYYTIEREVAQHEALYQQILNKGKV
jgi:glycosyltransferase involved in cell wall biosynthesis